MSLASCLFEEDGARVRLGRTGIPGVVFPEGEPPMSPLDMSLKLMV